MLEPSAGTGLLAVLAELSGASLALNELGETRAELLSLLFPGTAVTRFDAAHIDDHLDTGITPSVVLMNPPFSAQNVNQADHVSLSRNQGAKICGSSQAAMIEIGALGSALGARAVALPLLPAVAGRVVMPPRPPSQRPALRLNCEASEPQPIAATSYVWRRVFCGFRGSGNKSALEFEGITSMAKALVSPLRVKSAVLTACRSLPVFPDKQTAFKIDHSIAW